MIRLLRKAGAAKAQVVHFAEAALSGYGRDDLLNGRFDVWETLDAATKELVAVATELSVWTVFGSCRQTGKNKKPINCVYVVSPRGEVSTYDKQRLTPAEDEWYEPGIGELVVDIGGIRCGFSICYEANFDELWKKYADDKVRVMFHSGHNISRKPRPLLDEVTLAQLRTRAWDHGFNISHATSSAKHAFSTAMALKPDGSVTKLPKHRTGMLVHDITIADR